MIRLEHLQYSVGEFRLHDISLHVEGEWLVGTARITKTETVGEGEDARTNITNRYEEMRIPWEEVDTVEADIPRKTSHLLLAAGGVALGIVAFLLFTGGSDSPPADNGGKPPP